MTKSSNFFGVFSQLQAARNLSFSMDTGSPARSVDLKALGLDKSLAKRFKR